MVALEEESKFKGNPTLLLLSDISYIEQSNSKF